MLVHARTLRAGAVVRSRVAHLTVLFFTLGFFLLPRVQAQNAAPAPNSDPTYQALRNIALGTEAVTVTNFDLERDAGKFHLHSGTVCFVAAVEGKVTGAVFVGDGNFVLAPASATERAFLKLLTKEDEFSEKFERMVLRFTDSTYDELKKGGTAGGSWGDRGYWKVVTPHEVAHQWWGQTVGFANGRDQWMSEGFAEMSASLYVSMVEKNPKKFITFWNDEREILLEKNAQGFRAIDVGPLTMGYRASNSRTGFNTTRRLIYPKGAYVLHMLRMMLHDNRNGDQAFKDMMQDFVKTYSGKAATTEDFKLMVEKHMTREMDLDGNQKMDWFFNEYVYGTQIPSYRLDSSFDTGTDGTVTFNMKLTQSGVDDKFKMLVPIYLEMDDGRLFALGRAHVTGNSSVEDKVPLNGLKTKPKRAVLNYYDDVLATP